MKISKEASRVSRQLFRVSLTNGVLNDDIVRTVVRKVTASKPRGYIAILQNFTRLVRAEIERQSAVVESATPLNGDLQYQIKTGLSKKYGRELALQYNVNPELLGGIRVKVGSDVWDGTIKARLENLRAELA